MFKLQMESVMSLEMPQEASLFPVDPGEDCRMIGMDYGMDTEDLSLSNSHSEIDEVLETMQVQMATPEKVSSSSATQEAELEEKVEAIIMEGVGEKDEADASGKEESAEEFCPEDVISEKSSQSSITGCSISSSSSLQNTPATSRPETPLLENLVENGIHHPAEVMEQENYMERLNLITHATLKHKTENKKVERRRRTTANPKYNRNGFIDLSHMGKRHRKHEEALEALQRSLAAPISAVVPKIPKDNCVVCEALGGNLTCETCGMRVHSDCIKVSGTKAPVPIRLPKCPDCVTAANVALWEPELQYFATNIINSTISTAVKRKPPAKHKKAKKPKRDSPQKSTVPERQTGVSPEAATFANGEMKALKLSPLKPALTGSSGGSSSSASSPAKALVKKKKSKVNGVKAKTLSVTGNGVDNGTNSVQSAKPAILMEAGSEVSSPPRVKPPPIRSVSRLPKQTVNPISVERTMLAMSAAARCVMSNSGLPKVLSAATASSSGNIPGTMITVTTSTVSSDQVLPKADVPATEFPGNGTNHENIAPAGTCAPPPVQIN